MERLVCDDNSFPTHLSAMGQVMGHILNDLAVPLFSMKQRSSEAYRVRLPEKESLKMPKRKARPVFRAAKRAAQNKKSEFPLTNCSPHTPPAAPSVRLKRLRLERRLRPNRGKRSQKKAAGARLRRRDDMHWPRAAVDVVFQAGASGRHHEGCA
jgi:hypothetical protein